MKTLSRLGMCSIFPLVAALIAWAVLAGAAFAIQPGLYADQNAPGHGLAIFEAPDNHRVASWYTYGPVIALDADGERIAADPEQVWFISDNFLPGDQVDVFRPDAFFPSQFFELGPSVGTIRVREHEAGIRVDFNLFEWPKGCDGLVSVGAPWCTGTVFLSLLAAQ